ncbi:uncharacterized protein LOC113851220 [Abrus precatorius]|uniref:Uncharacterized protein LOC113851220 n=1 Tax=Abrus precatorius TaxID=3816 RepID=A0A8B8K381_ABRPR|nr:uncharacterized protein LOC113851220 [Abrus precatorius]
MQKTIADIHILRRKNQCSTYKSPLDSVLTNSKTKAHTTNPMSSLLLSVFHSLRKSKGKDRLSDLRSPFNVHETPLFSSYSAPIASAYVRAHKLDKTEVSLHVEETCRIFENYLVEMIVEEGKMRDLMDVEEFLYCWKNIKCPVFIDLICRFYVEICKDLFSSDSEEGCSILTDG